MRYLPLPAPTEEEIRTRRIHELVRDYPELLSSFDALGVDVGEAGGKTLPALLPKDGSWIDTLREAVRWREESDG